MVDYTMTHKRKPVSYLFTRLPLSPLFELAKVAKEGAAKYDTDGITRRWRFYSALGDDSGLNHAWGHLCELSDLTPGSPSRIKCLAKAAFNLLIQIYVEKRLGERLMNQEDIGRKMRDDPKYGSGSGPLTEELKKDIAIREYQCTCGKTHKNLASLEYCQLSHA